MERGCPLKLAKNLEPSEEDGSGFLELFMKGSTLQPVLQIRRDNRDNLGIIDHISP